MLFVEEKKVRSDQIRSDAKYGRPGHWPTLRRPDATCRTKGRIQGGECFRHVLEDDLGSSVNESLLSLAPSLKSQKNRF